jgi:hypothetical protein
MGRVKFDKNKKPVQILSLGAGKQSTFMLLKALNGDFSILPDYAVFADTGNEPNYVYSQLNYLKKYCSLNFGFEISIVSGGNLVSDIENHLLGKTKWSPTPPLWEKKGGNLRRQCTDHLKLRPVKKFIRSVSAGRPVNLWIGISTDEIERQTISQLQYINHFYPLLENKISINTIKNWYKSSGYPEPGKSACVICPFHTHNYWRRLKIVEPNSFKEAIEFDKRIRYFKKNEEQFFLHRNRQPLENAMETEQLSLFPEMIEECSGLCGL